MSDPGKDFTPIQGDYEFFSIHSTEADSDLAAYAARLKAFQQPTGPIRMLDFGCGPGSFTERFLDRFGWKGDRLDLALVEPSAAYRAHAVARLAPRTTRPVQAWPALPDDLCDDRALVLSNHVFYYVPDLENTLNRIMGTLEPGGLFVTAIAQRDNALVDLWFRGFPLIGRPVPYHTAEDVETALIRLELEFDQQSVPYDLTFPDSEENRLKILRFLFGEHLALLPIDQLLAFFDPYSAGDWIKMRTGNRQYYVQRGS